MAHTTRSAPGHARTGAASAVAPMRAPLAIYLNDHLFGATLGSELARRVAKQHAMSAAGATLVRLADEIAQDRATLLLIMRDLGVPVRRYKMGAGWLLEKAGRTKTNGFLVRRAPLSSVIELENLRLGVEGKRLMWLALRAMGGPQSSVLDDEQLSRLLDRAQEQSATLEELRLRAAADVLSRY
ncbi:hypothetical protein [Streptomyces sp. WMMB 322]|uniref:hypothetical protein n=1 Tax=Streptomyces sp. WMMB 322 TaxID=1286821 RepID=UPI000823DF88|nr:hypothetical protein [Streptomyces sp. WMMB 322]SCK45484.1 hypothetical protein H180DRAFT_04016 [Streptomyces sp. WMMB 322]